MTPQVWKVHPDNLFKPSPLLAGGIAVLKRDEVVAALEELLQQDRQLHHCITLGHTTKTYTTINIEHITRLLDELKS